MSVTDNPHRLAARTQFALANQAATAAENATKDPALKNISKANTYYNAATGEILLLILERIESWGLPVRPVRATSGDGSPIASSRMPGPSARSIRWPPRSRAIAPAHLSVQRPLRPATEQD
jgi:hypothetical protein